MSLNFRDAIAGLGRSNRINDNSQKVDRTYSQVQPEFGVRVEMDIMSSIASGLPDNSTKQPVPRDWQTKIESTISAQQFQWLPRTDLGRGG